MQPESYTNDEARGGRRPGFRGPGATSGGLGSFLFGSLLAVAGIYLIMNQTLVTSGYWGWWGQSTFGLTLIPLILGIGLLFFDGRSIAGWLLAGAGVVIILAGILANVQIHLRTTSLFDLLLMFGLFAAGLGLIARSLAGE